MRSLSSFALVCLAGCAEPPGAVSLKTSASHYSAGATVVATLANDTDAIIHYNLCALRLEQRFEEGWTSDGLPEKPATCPTVLEALPPHAHAEGTYALDPTLSPGDYRLITSVEHALREEIASPGFRIDSL